MVELLVADGHDVERADDLLRVALHGESPAEREARENRETAAQSAALFGDPRMARHMVPPRRAVKDA